MIAALLALSLIASDPQAIPVSVPSRAKPVSYAREVAEVLDARCTGCHSEALSEGKLRLDSVEAMKKGGKRGPALVPGKADESLLFRMAAHRVEPAMPPKDKPSQKPMTPEELGLLKLWIDAGASDDSAEVGAKEEKPIQLGTLPPGVHPILAVDMTADGRLIAIGRANLVQVIDSSSGLVVATLGGHQDLVQSVRFRPDGRALAAGSYQVVTRWNLPETGERKTLAGHGGPVRALAASADGTLLVSAGEDQTVRVWDAAQGKEIRAIGGASSPILSVAVSPDGRRIAAGSADGSIRVLDRAEGKPLAQVKSAGAAAGVAFGRGGQILAATAPDGALRIWSVSEAGAIAEPEPTVRKGHAGAILTLSATADGSTFATAGEDGAVRFWSGDDGHALGDMRIEGVRVAAIAPDGKRIACASGDRATIFGRDGKPLAALEALKAPITAIAFSPDGNRLAAATNAGGVKVWECSNGAGVAAFGHQGDNPNAPAPPISSVSFLGQDSLATGSAGKTVKLWACSGAWSESPALGPHAFRVLALAYSPDGKLLAAGGGEPSRSGEVKIWDEADGHLVRTAPANLHSDTVYGLAFRPDGTALASASADRFVKVIAVADGKDLRSFEGHTGQVLSVDWSEDGKQLVSGGADNVAKVWDFETGEQVRTLPGPQKPVTSVRWTRGENPLIAGCSGDRIVRYWDPKDGGVRNTFGGATGYLMALAVSKDRTLVAAGGADGVLFLWNGQSGQLLRKVE